VIRVFSIPDGQKLFEFRRGMKRLVKFDVLEEIVYASSCLKTVNVFLYVIIIRHTAVK